MHTLDFAATLNKGQFRRIKGNGSAGSHVSFANRRSINRLCSFKTESKVTNSREKRKKVVTVSRSLLMVLDV